MSSTIAIDPDGDISLQLLQQQLCDETDTPDQKTVDEKPEMREFTVSSKVLSLASPVFKAMLSGRFKEGIDLARGIASTKSYALNLPDDDAEATIILCRILHFNINDVPEKPTPVCLEKLAFLCDKYQCISAMKYCGSVWLRDWLLASDSEVLCIDDLCRLLIFAYVIDLPHEFLGVSWRLFLYHKGPFIGPYTQVVILLDHPLLHHDVAGTATLFLTPNRTAVDRS